jgi:hypothetical protein
MRRSRRKYLEPVGGYSTPVVLDTLCLVMENPPDQDVINRWTDEQRRDAYDWAMRIHLKAGDNAFVRLRPKPAFLLEASE